LAGRVDILISHCELSDHGVRSKDISHLTFQLLHAAFGGGRADKSRSC
jgi:hypothetical protein